MKFIIINHEFGFQYCTLQPSFFIINSVPFSFLYPKLRALPTNFEMTTFPWFIYCVNWKYNLYIFESNTLNVELLFTFRIIIFSKYIYICNGRNHVGTMSSLKSVVLLSYYVTVLPYFYYIRYTCTYIYIYIYINISVYVHYRVWWVSFNARTLVTVNNLIFCYYFNFIFQVPPKFC